MRRKHWNIPDALKAARLYPANSELELKHLAPYAPFKLRMRICFTDLYEEGILKAVGLHPFDGQSSERLTVHIKKADNNYRQVIIGGTKSICKPILRPISDLTGFILNDLAKWLWKQQPEDFDILESAVAWFQLIRMDDLLNLPYKVITKLCELHFDVFGLIAAGLAFDINNAD